MSALVGEHRQYIQDHHRLEAFQAAISSVVRPDSMVLDLASGTGVLGLLACRAGAAKVYSIEVGGMIQVARELAAANGYGDRVVFLHGLSTQVELPERVDLLLADQIGSFGFNAGVVEFYADARKRFLKPEGRTIPARLSIRVAPWESAELFHNSHFWNDRPLGFDFAPAGRIAQNSVHEVDLEPTGGLGREVEIAAVDFSSLTPGPIGSVQEIPIERGGILHGLGGWFQADLSPDVLLTNSPFSAKKVRRSQVYLPLRHAVPVQTGDLVRVQMTIMPTGSLVNWNVTVLAADGGKKAQFRHSTFKGMLLPEENARRCAPDYVPLLNRPGRARRSVVDLCDGKRTNREIADEVFRRHPEVFSDPDESALFVAEVLTAYSE